MIRRRLRVKRDRKTFARTARRFTKANITPVSSRGGRRM